MAILTILIIYCVALTRELCGEVHHLNNQVNTLNSSIVAYTAVQDSIVVTLNNAKIWIMKYENPDKKKTRIIFDE